ncbi:NAD(P)-dependent oxidoreductase [Pedococcus bigeumensis]|uniref:NAD(P)-dependent oxidoreductase n=1 Tax=Pedococcus bigeumensis TaxID=433644 RepID=UPI0019D5ACBA|nr:NAD(P)-dependent oxidoreductase [Pedococcus bigeumensis]
MEQSLTIGIVSPGAMGSALGRAWQAAGAGVLTTVDGRSERTRSLAHGLQLVADLDAVVAGSDVVVSVVPPGAALATMTPILDAARRGGVTPLVADLNAVSPATVGELADMAAAAGHEFVDGAISGGPPEAGSDTMLYLSGSQAAVLAAVTTDGLRTLVVGSEPGSASAVKMCTASVYKGTTALWAQALQTAHAHGVLDVVLADLADAFPGTAARAGRLIAVATSKSERFVAEMEQIAATQGAADASPELFEGMAAVYSRLSRTRLAELSPEEARDLTDLTEVLTRLAPDPGQSSSRSKAGA